ncbi:MAG: hypothetical protein C0596_14915 [Marinilabiliales bacterium]|nr:MAG: hypothetical protein C0596_14915 [Marinilabiliales bacterium]
MKKALVWIIAVIITLGASYYQRISGPTYPMKISDITGDANYSSKLIRSSETGEYAHVIIDESSAFDKVLLVYSKYPGEFKNDTIHVKNTGGLWEAYLPDQPPAGKLKYYVVLFSNGEEIWSNKDNPAIIRFKDPVPIGVLIPHVLAMLTAMLFSMVTLFMIILKKGNYKRMSYLTVAVLLVGGFILGPIMQNYAFGEFWTGWPNVHDFTDNKTLIAFLIWVIAMIINFKKDRKWAIIVASVSMLIVFSIPHSMGGSEYNYEEGVVETGNK